MTVHGRRREMGLGSIDDVSLAEARRDADRWRAIVREGRDPIKEREHLRREAQRAAHTLEDVLAEVMERKRHELRSEASWQRWDSPLKTHVIPKLGKVPISQIDGTDIANTLRPIWHEKAETARKTINRLGQVITHAAAMGLDADLQAVAKARALLGRQKAVSRHHEAMAWKDVPTFWQSLGGNPAELALKFLILTAVRSAPVRFMTRAEVTLVASMDGTDEGLWEMPANRRKTNANEPFRVPLSDMAMAVIDAACAVDWEGPIFANARGKPLSDAAMARVLDRRQIAARPHGFRSSFRDWCEAEGVRFEVAEFCLDHAVGNRVERAYRRDDLLDERRRVLQSWTDFVCSSTRGS